MERKVIAVKLYLNNYLNFNIGLTYDVLQNHSNLSLNYNNLVLHRKIERHYSFLNMPISFCFQLNKTKLKPFTVIGLQGSMLQQNESEDDEIWHIKRKLFNNGSFIAFYDFGLGVSYKINSKLDLTFSLNYYKSFIPLVWQDIGQSGMPITNKIYLDYYKGNIGVVYHFNK